jgi:hypothetical protein
VNFPLIVRGPGVPHGVRNDKLVGNHDIAPTLVSMGHASIPSFVDGRSFLSLAQDPSTPWPRTAILSERETNLEPPDLWDMLRMDGSNYIRYADGQQKVYYDLGLDPRQIHNAFGASDTAYPPPDTAPKPTTRSVWTPSTPAQDSRVARQRTLRCYRQVPSREPAPRTLYSPKCVEGKFSEVQWCKARGYSHRPNATNATPITAAATNAASNVASNTKGILTGLGQIFEHVEVLDDDVALLELYRPCFLEPGESPAHRHPLAAYHRAQLLVGVVGLDAQALAAHHPF